MSAAFDPKGKAFKERLDAFLKDAKDSYAQTVRVDNGRTVECSGQPKPDTLPRPFSYSPGVRYPSVECSRTLS